MSARPRIGVTLSERRSFWIWIMHWHAIVRAGGWPLKITAKNPRSCDQLDGIVVGGGDDISFQYDDAEFVPNARYDPARDSLERTLLEDAFERDLPVLGVCRGAQMVNLVKGGTLHSDLADISDTSPPGTTVLPRKIVELERTSRLAEIMRCNPCRVNALHHQAVDRPGDGLRIVARDQDGIVQGIEAPNTRFLVGVQWHPELLPASVSQMNIFKALVQAAA